VSVVKAATNCRGLFVASGGDLLLLADKFGQSDLVTAKE
jgi:hypothetical protein